MKTRTVGELSVVVPENKLDMALLQFLASDHFRPKDYGYWDVKPDSVDWDGKIFVGWSKKGEQTNSRLDAFFICQNDYGFAIELLPKEAT